MYTWDCSLNLYQLNTPSCFTFVFYTLCTCIRKKPEDVHRRFNSQGKLTKYTHMQILYCALRYKLPKLEIHDCWVNSIKHHVCNLKTLGTLSWFLPNILSFFFQEKIAAQFNVAFILGSVAPRQELQAEQQTFKSLLYSRQIYIIIDGPGQWCCTWKRA